MSVFDQIKVFKKKLETDKELREQLAELKENDWEGVVNIAETVGCKCSVQELLSEIPDNFFSGSGINPHLGWEKPINAFKKKLSMDEALRQQLADLAEGDWEGIVAVARNAGFIFSVNELMQEIPEKFYKSFGVNPHLGWEKPMNTFKKLLANDEGVRQKLANLSPGDFKGIVDIAKNYGFFFTEKELIREIPEEFYQGHGVNPNLGWDKAYTDPWDMGFWSEEIPAKSSIERL